MSLNPVPAISNKATPSNSTLSSPQPQSGPTSPGDTAGYRRSGGSGSFGAGAASRVTGTPRSNQASKKQHKQSKKARLSDEDAFAETSAMRSINSRKGQTSITHLMNFTLPPRPQYQHNNYTHGRSNRRNPTWGLGSGYHAADKARYVHANYRFIVDPRANYHAQATDADVHLDWSNVLQILASSESQDASCPICLGHPVAPRMARCGHIFCLPCLIRYMHSEDGDNRVPEKKARWKPCPMCQDHIYTSETRPVRWYKGQEQEPPREGMDIIFRLVKRDNGSTLALPRDGADALAKGEDIPWYIAAEVMDYARIMKGSETYMIDQFDNDIQELTLQGKEDELMFGEDNLEWVQRSTRMISDAKEKVKGIGEPPSMPQKPKVQRTPIEFTDDADAPVMYNLQRAVNSGQSLSPAASAVDSSSTAEANATSTRKLSSISSTSSRTEFSGISRSLHQHRQIQQSVPPSEYYFYQALPHYYLPPLDIRILRAAFGPYSSFPSTLLPRIERVTHTVVDDDVRKRTRYLAHLPYGCEVGFLECDWTDTVPSSILERFDDEIEKRRIRHEEKEAKEEKARIRAEKLEEEIRFGPGGRKGKGRSGDDEGDGKDGLSAEDFAPLTFGSADTPAGTTPPVRQGFGALASPSTSPNNRRTVWGTAVIAPSSPGFLPQEVLAPVDDGWLQGWEKDLINEEDALIKEATALSLADGQGSNAAIGGGKKKNKKKKVVLMSTGARGPRA